MNNGNDGNDDFVPSSSFSGPRQGFYFSSGDRGIGYYRDGVAGGQAQAPPQQRLDGAALLARAERAAAAAAAATGTGADEAAPSTSMTNLDDLLLDAASVRRLASALRKRSEANAVSRAKHPDDPTAFLPSELALDDAIRALQRVAPFPDLFPALLSTDAVESLVGLLSHENADIAGAVLEVLQELTDVDDEGGEGEENDDVEALAASAASLARSFVGAGGGEAAAERLSAFDESVPEEANFLFAGLGALLNMSELDEGCARSFVGASASGGKGGGDEGKTAAAPTTKKLLPWLLRRISSSPSTSTAASEFSSITQAASELVSTLAQAGTAGALSVVAASGVDSLLRALARYRKRAPAPGSGDELEHVANLFDALCALLLRPEGREAFVESEGVELLLLLIRKHGSGSDSGEGEAAGGKAESNKLAAASASALASQALRCLEFATTSGGDGGGGEASSSAAAAAAKRFVEGGGLGPLFGGFMGRSRLGRGIGGSKRDKSGQRACLSLVVNLLQRLDPEGEEEAAKKGEEETTRAAPSPFARVLSKFRESNFEKLDRLVDLSAAASASLAAHDARAAARDKLRAQEEGQEEADEEEEEDEEIKAKKMAARLSAGGDDLQLCALAAAYCWSSFSSSSSSSLDESESKAARTHFVRSLHSKGMTLSGLRRVLEGRRAALGGGGGGGGEEVKSAEERRLTRLLSALGGKGGKGGEEDDSEQQRPEKRART